LEQAALHQHHVGALARNFAVALLCHDQPNFPAARRTQASNAVKSRQMSSGLARGVTSGEPCRSSAWIIIRLSGSPKSSTVSPSASTRRLSDVLVTVVKRATRPA